MQNYQQVNFSVQLIDRQMEDQMKKIEEKHQTIVSQMEEQFESLRKVQVLQLSMHAWEYRIIDKLISLCS